MAADCAPLQPLEPGVQLSAGAGVLQIFSPVSSFTAWIPPGLAPLRRPKRSETAAYAYSVSAVVPHSIPPRALPCPSRVCHSILPRLSGSSPQRTADFWPQISTRLPLGSSRKTGEVPKSKSGPRSSGQFTPRPQPMVKLSFGRTWLDHLRLPVSISQDRIALLVLMDTFVYELPVAA